MKRLFRIVCHSFAAAALSMGGYRSNVNDVVDKEQFTHGYVTVNYSSSARLQGWYSVQRWQDRIL